MNENDGWEPVKCKGCKETLFALAKQEQSDGTTTLAYFCVKCAWTTEVEIVEPV